MRSLVKSTMTLDLAEYWHAYGIQNVNQLRMAGVLLYDKMWVPAFARTTEQEHREVTQGLSLPRRWKSILALSCGSRLRRNGRAGAPQEDPVAS